jgi:hypothetical protein
MYEKIVYCYIGNQIHILQGNFVHGIQWVLRQDRRLTIHLPSSAQVNKTYSITLGHVLATTVAVEKQYYIF